jgi:sigma-B regulation protein RsbU (phosphoserine phosphatase)
MPRKSETFIESREADETPILSASKAKTRGETSARHAAEMRFLISAFFQSCMSPEIDRILIAEDHHVSRHLLERNLQNWGFEVVSATDGEAAVEILETPGAPSIAVLDWMMPKMDGVEVCRRVRQQVNRPYIYLLLLTAKSQKEEIAAGLDAGADDYVVKPFDPSELRARLTVGQRVVALERALAKRVQDLQTALDDVKRLKRLLPICMYCKSVRDDQDYWRQIDEYIHVETGTDFSHGICPSCLDRLTKGNGTELG